MANPNQFYGGGYPAVPPGPTSNVPAWNQPVMYPINQQMYNQPTQVIQQNPQPVAQPQIQPQRFYIPGREVQPGEKIMANEVPGDGTISVFPIADATRSKILVKAVNESGTIDTVTYVRVEEGSEETTAPTTNDILPSILERLENIEKMVKKNSYHYRKKPTKKEGENV